MTKQRFNIDSCSILNLQPDLSENPFLRVLKFNLTEIVCKKDWERKAEKLPKLLFKLFDVGRMMVSEGIGFNSLFLSFKFWK